MKGRYVLIVRVLYMILGFYIVSCGMVIMLKSGLGVNTWNVLNTGISKQIGVSLGAANQIIGLICILSGWMLKIKPSFATFANMYFVGFFVDLMLLVNIIPNPGNCFYQWIYLVIGTVVLSIGNGIYINAKLGTGPRDSLLMGIIKKTKWNIKSVKTLIEIIVLVTGILFGGEFGLGTVVHVFIVGPILQWSVNHFQFPFNCGENSQKYVFNNSTIDTKI